MDPRRLLTLACAGLSLCGCATLRPRAHCEAVGPEVARAAAVPAPAPGAAARPARTFTAMAPIPDPPSREKRTRSAVAGSVGRAATAPGGAYASGRRAIAAANLMARERSREAAFVGGLQVFSYQPGRIYEVWTAPLRVTTLTLGPSETIISKAAGDTVRWQIGETTSGEGKGQRAHVMVKPLRRGLETNLVLTTSERVYLIELRSGAPESFNPEIAWDAGAVARIEPPEPKAPASPTPPSIAPAGPLDARFRIVPHGRAPAWTPLAVMTDETRTFLSFPPGLSALEAPVLFVIGPQGETELVNYRQEGGLWVVDRVFNEAELRLGGRHGEVVRIIRAGAHR